MLEPVLFRQAEFRNVSTTFCSAQVCALHPMQSFYSSTCAHLVQTHNKHKQQNYRAINGEKYTAEGQKFQEIKSKYSLFLCLCFCFKYFIPRKSNNLNMKDLSICLMEYFQKVIVFVWLFCVWHSFLDCLELF